VCICRRFVWRRFVEETFCRGDVSYVRLIFYYLLFYIPTCISLGDLSGEGFELASGLRELFF
jgi:hypothetical protein